MNANPYTEKELKSWSWDIPKELYTYLTKTSRCIGDYTVTEESLHTDKWVDEEILTTEKEYCDGMIDSYDRDSLMEYYFRLKNKVILYNGDDRYIHVLDIKTDKVSVIDTGRTYLPPYKATESFNEYLKIKDDEFFNLDLEPEFVSNHSFTYT